MAFRLAISKNYAVIPAYRKLVTFRHDIFFFTIHVFNQSIRDSQNMYMIFKRSIISSFVFFFVYIYFFQFQLNMLIMFHCYFWVDD